MGGRSAARLGAAALVAMLVALGARGANAQDDAEFGDPWERMNRGIFRFNEGADRWVVEPIAKGWDFVVPDPFERGIRRFFDNAMFPVHFANALLQGKPKSALIDLSRFVVNVGVGIGGLFDPATHLGLESSREDFGQTLGHWGVPPGPYLVLPLLGPSNPRDAVGLAADSAAQIHPYFLPFWITSSITAGNLINRRSLAIELIREERAAALDYYVAVRNAYLSHREDLVRDRQVDESDEEDLYHLD